MGGIFRSDPRPLVVIKPANKKPKNKGYPGKYRHETLVSKRVDKLKENPRSVFSMPERAAILQLCRTNNWDFEGTAKMLGIKATTLRTWRKGVVLEKMDTHSKAVIDQLIIALAPSIKEEGIVAIPRPMETIMKLDKGINAIVDQAITARQLAIDRILAIIPDEKRVDNLLAVIKDMNIIIKSDDDIIGEGGGGILPALQKLTNNSNIDQDEIMANLMSKLQGQSNFIQINNFQKDTTEDAEVVQEEIKTEEDEND